LKTVELGLQLQQLVTQCQVLRFDRSIQSTRYLCRNRIEYRPNRLFESNRLSLIPVVRLLNGQVRPAIQRGQKSVCLATRDVAPRGLDCRNVFFDADKGDSRPAYALQRVTCPPVTMNERQFINDTDYGCRARSPRNVLACPL